MANNFEVWWLVLLIGLVGLIQNAESEYRVYDTESKIVPGKLNVHLVPHTHDDVGWLKTVDQYYVGSNNSIQGACVQNVLDSLIPTLLADKNRKFIYVEQAFFQRWWRNQSPAMQETVRGLVNEGRLEFINGGWCMHDEAATHYIDMIDQTTLGHRYIKEQFNVTPRVGWQIDPFGHSAIQAYLLGAEVGFDSLFFGRIDYQDREKRKVEKALEVVWQGSKSLGSTAQIFAGAFPKNYEPPEGGFYYEVNSASPVVQDDPALFDYNVEERVNAFVAAAYWQANITRTNHIMFTMGTDFQYQYALTWFRNMDKLIHYVNKDGRVNAMYSTPSIYTDAKYASNESWPLKTDDYFPYADRINAYWTGYFTSRPALKRYVREMSGYYLAARQLEFFKGRNEAGPTTDSLADALAIAQHHDAVSGTSQQHVANDYAKRLAIGYKEAEDVVSASLAFLADSSSKSGYKSSERKFKQCPLLNISYCPPTEVDLSPGKRLMVVIYNSLGWKRDEIVKVPVTSVDVAVQDSAGKEIVSQILPVVNVSMALRRFYATANVGKPPSGGPLYWLAFKAEVPPLGFRTYIVTSSKRAASVAVASVREETFYGHDESQNNAVEVGPGNLKLVYSGSSGKLTEYIQSNIKGTNTVKFSVDQSYSYYIGDDGSKDPPSQLQASGAYVFRPNSTFPIQSQEKIPLTVLRGPLFDEAHQSISPWIYQVTRVYKEKQHAEVEFIVGPIPIDDRLGKEIVTKIDTSIKSNQTFYTDSNGRDYLKRIRNYRSDWKLEVNQPVAGNYYPINHGIYMQDDSTEFSVLVDRAVGGSSILDGQLELMLHRRLLHDDGRGVAEALNETTCIPDGCKGLTIQGKYYFKFDPLGEGAKWRRSFGQEIYSPLLLAFSEQDGDSWNNFQVPTFTGIDPSYSLPDNVAMITLEELVDGTVLLRLAHLYEVGEDKDLSVPANVELKKLFPNKKINKITEMGLSANQKREDMEKKRLAWRADSSSDATKKPSRGGPVDPMRLVVQLAPMEIRTFTIEFGKKLSTTSR
ncbi:OLC1v1014408C1 [Oldenlandia corymbosa var. corymbosa]|uniref:Alpha-mannosidase n=1 Tax=Oldenlandia corymbosa var. corymbosa TaxID=529605 RepID=A0AAV1E0Y7_OLDCO|nr:OLC1v1014408C1 [Oldenlandia corymbosa var. corymbosa]